MVQQVTPRNGVRKRVNSVTLCGGLLVAIIIFGIAYGLVSLSSLLGVLLILLPQYSAYLVSCYGRKVRVGCSYPVQIVWL